MPSARHANRGLRRELYYYRDQQGLEVDFIVPMPSGAYQLIEAKATRSPNPDMAKPMLSLARTWKVAIATRELVGCTLVHREARTALKSSALAPGAVALTFGQLVEVLNAASVTKRRS